MKQLEEAIPHRDWIYFVALHERPYRVETLLDLMNEYGVSGEELWPVVGWVWTDTESVRHTLNTWRSIWSMHCP